MIYLFVAELFIYYILNSVLDFKMIYIHLELNVYTNLRV